jgi:hypothetical protein
MFPIFPSPRMQTDLVDVLRPRFGHDQAGGSKQDFEPVVNLCNLAASIQPIHGNAVRMLGQRQVILTHHIYLFSLPSINRGDLLYCQATQKSYLVHGVEDMGGRGQVWQVEAKLIT